MKYIPYQKCPICEGQGRTHGGWASSATFVICSICQGSGIIPMFGIDPKEVMDKMILQDDNPLSIKPEVYLGLDSNEYKNLDKFEPDTTCGDLEE